MLRGRPRPSRLIPARLGAWSKASVKLREEPQGWPKERAVWRTMSGLIMGSYSLRKTQGALAASCDKPWPPVEGKAHQMDWNWAPCPKNEAHPAPSLSYCLLDYIFLLISHIYYILSYIFLPLLFWGHSAFAYSSGRASNLLKTCASGEDSWGVRSLPCEHLEDVNVLNSNQIPLTSSGGMEKANER